MADLEDAFGEDFTQQYKRKIAERRQQREQATEDDLREIAHLAINEGKFQDGEPRFSFVNENDIEHEVRLMQLPKMEGKSIFGYANELDSGAVTCPLDYMGEWMSCLFNDPEDLKEMEPGEHYIVVGKLDQWTNDKGQTNDQISPVRGTLTLEQAKVYANQMLDEEGPNDQPTQTSEEQEEEETGSDDDGSAPWSASDDGGEPEEAEDTDDTEDALDELALGDEEEEEEESPVDYEEVQGTVETLAEKEPAVWDVEDGDERLNKLTKVTARHLELPEDDSVMQEVQNYILRAIDEHNTEDDEDDEEDAIF